VQSVLKIILTGPESSGKTTMAQALADTLGAPLVPEFARSYLAHLGRPYRRDDLPAIARGQQAWENWFAANRLIVNGKESKTLICDTDWTVIRVWEEYKFGGWTEDVGRWTEDAGLGTEDSKLLDFQAQHPTPPASNVQHPTSPAQHPTSNVQHPQSNLQRPQSNVPSPTSNVPNSQTRFYFLCAPDIPWQPDALREHPHERAQLFEHYEHLLRRERLPYHILRGPHAERLQMAQTLIRELF
jgi:nicotinamide riboside kinase